MDNRKPDEVLVRAPETRQSRARTTARAAFVVFCGVAWTGACAHPGDVARTTQPPARLERPDAAVVDPGPVDAEDDSEDAVAAALAAADAAALDAARIERRQSFWEIQKELNSLFQAAPLDISADVGRRSKDPCSKTVTMRTSLVASANDLQFTQTFNAGCDDEESTVFHVQPESLKGAEMHSGDMLVSELDRLSRFHDLADHGIAFSVPALHLSNIVATAERLRPRSSRRIPTAGPRRISALVIPLRSFGLADWDAGGESRAVLALEELRRFYYRDPDGGVHEDLSLAIATAAASRFQIAAAAFSFDGGQPTTVADGGSPAGPASTSHGGRPVGTAAAPPHTQTPIPDSTSQKAEKPPYNTLQ